MSLGVLLATGLLAKEFPTLLQSYLLAGKNRDIQQMAGGGLIKHVALYKTLNCSCNNNDKKLN